MNRNNILKIINKYVFPILIFSSILGLLIYAFTYKKEGFEDCSCPDNTILKNGGCYSCDNEYKLNDDYYNPHCIALDSSGRIKPAIITKVVC